MFVLYKLDLYNFEIFLHLKVKYWRIKNQFHNHSDLGWKMIEFWFRLIPISLQFDDFFQIFFFYFFVATEQLTILVDTALINHVGTCIAYCGEV